MITICIVFTQNTKQGLTWIFPWSHPRVRFAGLISFAIYWKKKKRHKRKWRRNSVNHFVHTSSMLNIRPDPAWERQQRHGRSISHFIITHDWTVFLDKPSLRAHLHVVGMMWFLCRRHEPTELAQSFLFCSCVCFSLMVLSAVYHSIDSSDNSLFSHSVPPVLSLHYWSF